MKTKLKYSELVEGGTKDFRKIGKVTTESVEKCTGRGWAEWVKLLDQAGARSWSRREIVAFLKRKHELGPWWQQGVTAGYEVAIGRRVAGQDAKGKYMVTATKSLPVATKDLWKFLVSEKGLALWMQPLSSVKIQANETFETKDGFFGEVRTIAKARKIRLRWQDPERDERTVLEVLLVLRPGAKCVLVFNHTGIGAPKTQELLRGRWRTAAEKIAESL